MANQNFGEAQGFDFHEAAVDTTEVLGGAGLIGGVAVGIIAGVGEVVDQVLANGDNFPGGTLGKVAAGLVLVGAGLVGAHVYLDR